MRTFVKSLEVIELGSEATLAGGVDDEDDLALEVGQRVGCTLVVLGLEVVEGGCGRHVAGCGGGDYCWAESVSGGGKGLEQRGSEGGLAEARCY